MGSKEKETGKNKTIKREGKKFKNERLEKTC
jgi:hypothetical protein